MPDTIPPRDICFESGPWTGDYEDGCTTTCMLEAGHDGPHEFTPDSEIVIFPGPALLNPDAAEKPAPGSPDHA
jgi:hypothetical protein